MSAKQNFLRSRSSDQSGHDESQWMSVSDLMAGLMMVFLFIAIALMRNALIEKNQIKEVAVAYQQNQVAIYEALNNEFKDELAKWDATIDKDTLSFNFQSPDVLFDRGKVDVKPRFKEILNDFYPRYHEVITNFKSSINEVVIEGHTSSVWNKGTSSDEAYFKNMRLSQGRTRSVLRYVHELPEIANDKKWAKRHLAAVGYSSSRLIENKSGEEDVKRSRRVSFRIQTNAEIQIRKILKF
ncbi:MAG: cell envelope biogenesis protein OmpA [Cycloclasticus sp. symbiont of Poecilosclerida sp. N]|nr:MAG: cell envelope biogenesis protein OmpA [Cycloclasticus sp. symbiont of Poecilosclerida sp. N]ORU93139.1 MAG: cell envelope biogenesis protein OmpA [Cycloclasticus sp. symbiont of Poecilosclerida sp. N]